MTGSRADGNEPDLMGGPEPDEAATDVLEGPDPGPSDVMASPGAR